MEKYTTPSCGVIKFKGWKNKNKNLNKKAQTTGNLHETDLVSIVWLYLSQVHVY